MNSHSWNTVIFIQPLVQCLHLPPCVRVPLVIVLYSWAISTHWKDFMPFKIYIWNSLRLKETCLTKYVTEDKGFWAQQAVWEGRSLCKWVSDIGNISVLFISPLSIRITDREEGEIMSCIGCFPDKWRKSLKHIDWNYWKYVESKVLKEYSLWETYVWGFQLEERERNTAWNSLAPIPLQQLFTPVCNVSQTLLSAPMSHTDKYSPSDKVLWWSSRSIHEHQFWSSLCLKPSPGKSLKTIITKPCPPSLQTLMSLLGQTPWVLIV